MAEPRGLFVNPQNRGFGTILRDEGKGYLDYALYGQAQKKREAAAKAKAAQDRKDKFDELVVKTLKPLDTYKIYQEAANTKLNEAIDLYSKGELGYADLMRYSAEYAKLINGGKELQANDELAYENAVKNEEINEEAWVAMRNEKLLADQTVEGLQNRIRKPDSGVGFYQDQLGGSAVLNEQKVVNNAISALGEEVLQYTIDGKTEWLRGNKIKNLEEVKLKFKQAFTHDPVTNRFKVNDPQALIETGVAYSLMEQPNFKRIVLDKIIQEKGIAQDEITDEVLAETINEILTPYAGGEYSEEKKVVQQRYQTKTESETRKEEEDARRREWYQHLKSEDPQLTGNALSFLTQDDAELTGATLQRITKPVTGGGTRFGRRDTDGQPAIDPSKNYKIIDIMEDVANGQAIAKIIPAEEGKGGKPASSRGVDEVETTSPRSVIIDLKLKKDDPEFWLSLYNEAKYYGKSDYNVNKGGGLGTQPKTNTKYTFGQEKKKLPYTFE